MKKNFYYSAGYMGGDDDGQGNLLSRGYFLGSLNFHFYGCWEFLLNFIFVD